MSITRNSRQKRRATGGRMPVHQKKRKFEMGRVAGNTKIGEKRTIKVRGRGGNIKTRALKLDHGNYSWGSEAQARKCRIIDVVYNATNNELVRTKTLVKNAIVKIDATPFRQWYLQHYDVELNKRRLRSPKRRAPRPNTAKSGPRRWKNAKRARPLTRRCLTSSPEESFLHASHRARASPVAAMATSLKAGSLSSTLRRSRRRSEPGALRPSCVPPGSIAQRASLFACLHTNSENRRSQSFLSALLACLTS